MTPALLCLVVAISDGDTIKIRCPDEPQAVVRLAEIDAPEKAQPFGDRSRQHLAALCFRQEATVKPVTTDRYGRTVAHVECQQLDASTEQVRAGMAWVFDRYVKDLTLYQVQAGARAERRGLWKDDNPIAPWEWRRK